MLKCYCVPATAAADVEVIYLAEFVIFDCFLISGNVYLKSYSAKVSMMPIWQASYVTEGCSIWKSRYAYGIRVDVYLLRQHLN